MPSITVSDWSGSRIWSQTQGPGGSPQSLSPNRTKTDLVWPRKLEADRVEIRVFKSGEGLGGRHTFGEAGYLDNQKWWAGERIDIRTLKQQ